MKNLGLILIIFSLIACKNSSPEKKSQDNKINANKTTETAIIADDYQSFGKKFGTQNTWSDKKFLSAMADLSLQDTLQVKLRAQVHAVCQKKGCWVKLDLGQEQNMMVKFKNHAFFVPKDIKGQQVVVRGKAFIEKISVEQQRHYAKDAGKSKAEIQKITTPKTSYAFMANGILVKEKGGSGN